MRILLAEDEENIRDVVKLNLELEGYEVVEAVNGKEAVHFYTANKALVKMIEGTYIKSVKLAVQITNSSQINTGRMLCPGRHGRKHQAGY